MSWFPTPIRECHSDPLPLSARIARSLPILESTVPNGRRLGHAQDKPGRVQGMMTGGLQFSLRGLSRPGMLSRLRGEQRLGTLPTLNWRGNERTYSLGLTSV